METERHVEFLAGCPDWIVFGPIDMRLVTKMHRHGGKNDAAVADSDSTRDFFDGRFNRPERHDALWDETWARTRPFFDQPIVISLYAGELQIGIADCSETFARKSCEDRIENGTFDAIFVHRLQALRWVVRGFGYVFPLCRTNGVIWHESADGCDVCQH